MALLIQQSKDFASNLVLHQSRYDGLIDKLKTFIKNKQDLYNYRPMDVIKPVSSYDAICGSTGPLKNAVPGEAMRHVHLYGDSILFYTIVNSKIDPNDKIIKLYGIYSHKESGTDPSSTAKLAQDSSIVKTLKRLAGEPWTDTNLGKEEKTVGVKMVPISKVTLTSNIYNTRIVSDILTREAGLTIPEMKLRNMIKLLQQSPQAREKLADYAARNPIKAMRKSGDNYLPVDENDRHLVFLLKQISAKKVPVSPDQAKPGRLAESLVNQIKKLIFS